MESLIQDKAIPFEEIVKLLGEYDSTLLISSWKRRREHHIHLLNIIEKNIDYDIERYCKVQ